MSAVEALLHALTQRETFARTVAPSAFAAYEQALRKYGADVTWQLAGVTVLAAIQDAYAAVDEAMGAAPGYVTMIEGGPRDAMSAVSTSPFLAPAIDPAPTCRAGSAAEGERHPDCEWPQCRCDPAVAAVLDALELGDLVIVPRHVAAPADPADTMVAPREAADWQTVATAPCDGLPLVVAAPGWAGVSTRTWASEDRRDKSLKQPNPPTHWMRPALPVAGAKGGA